MNNLSLTLGVLALAGAVASTTLYLSSKNTERTLLSQLADTSARATDFESKLNVTKAHLDASQSKLVVLDAELIENRSRLSASETRNFQLTRETAALNQRLVEQTTAALELRQQLGSLQEELAAVRASSVPPGTIEAYKALIADLQQQVRAGSSGSPRQDAAPTAVFSTKLARKATVVSVGTENAFVVLNYGAAHGARPDQSLTILRGAEPLATALISDVRENFSIAQVRPDSLRGALLKGDSAVLAN